MEELTRRLAQRIPSGDLLYYAPSLSKPLHSINAQRLRLEGFLQAMAALKRSYRIVTTLESLSDFGGIVCATDYYALKALKHLGYPNDVIIAGFVNISALRDLPTKILTVEYSTNRIAEECLNYILGRRFAATIEHKLVYNTD